MIGSGPTLASVELFKVLLTGEKMAYFLMIGAYRDNEVDRSHPFILTLDDITGGGAAVQTIELGNLQPGDVRQLIQESLAGSTADSQALTELVYAKTQGNPFFTRQFLQNLYEEGWLWFDFDTCRWTWDVFQLEARDIADNVVELMTGKLRKLLPETANLLQLAACMGNAFDLLTLAAIVHTSVPTTRERLGEALTQGLVIPLDDGYKLPDTAARARFSFLHDQVQQAAYAQIPAPERQTVHLAIGRLLMANTPEADLDQRVFAIVQHYNRAGALITDPAERLRVAELNLQAADLAYAAAAFPSAQAYLEAALTLMPSGAWTNRYKTMLRLHSQLATVLALTGDFKQLKHVVQTTEAHAASMADMAEVKRAEIQVSLAEGDFSKALELGLSFIEAMGVSIDWNPSRAEALKYLQETAEWLTESRIAALPHLPEAPAEVRLILEFALVLHGPAHVTNPNLFSVLNSRLTRLCMEQGLAPWAMAALINFAELLCAALHDVPKARLLTDVTGKLIRGKYGLDSLITFLDVIMGTFVLHRHEHLRHTLPVLEEGFQKGLASGNFEFGGYAVLWSTCYHLFSGVPLAKVEACGQQAIEMCQKMRRKRVGDWCLQTQQAILNLQGKSAVPWILKGEAFDGEEDLVFALRVNDFEALFRAFFYKAWLHYVFDQPQAAVELFREAQRYLPYVAGTYLAALLYFYDTLANAAVSGPHATDKQPRVLERINRNLEQFEAWVRFAPMNHLHKRDLMKAEKARLQGRYWQAVTFYAKAIQGARDNEFLNEEALAYELCGKFWLEHGHQEIADVYLRKAHESYTLWGAVAKIEQLHALFGRGFGQRQRQHQTTWGTGRFTPPANRIQTLSWLDINTLLKANQTLSQTVNLSDLLAEMIKIMLENAGAEKALILCRDDEGWFIGASHQVKDSAIQTGLHLPLSEATTLSRSVFNYVIHSGKAIVLANATQDPQFGKEAYLREHAVKSVLCLPIWHKGKLNLVLYLENNLTVGAFAEGRLELLRLLSGQMAISLENAFMYDSLQTSIAERKRTEEALEKRIVALTQPLDTAEGIAFEDLFNLADMQRLQDLYAKALGVAALITRPDGTSITQPSNFCYLCSEIIRRTPQGARNCNYSDAMIGRYNPSGPSIQPCLSAGLWGAGASITVGGHHIANWLIGQVRNEGLDEQKIMKYAREIGADETAFRAAYLKVPVMSPERFERAAEVLFALANQMSASAFQNVQQARFIADRKRAEEELARHREHLEELVRERTRELEAAQEELLKRERLAVLGQLTATVSHELRNPLGVIQSSAFYPQTRVKNGDAKIRKHLNRIAAQVELCDGIVGELLEYTRGSGSAMREGAITPWLGKALDEARGTEGILITRVFSADLPQICFDATKLGRVLTNLLANAIVAVRDRRKSGRQEQRPYKPQIRIKAARAEGGVVINVEDNGTGMDAGTMRRASEPLFTTKARGTGLGLAIVKKIMKEHGGELRLESELHRGTKVTLWFPVRGGDP
ncbi:MAG: PocR ligand-binding domain-containing protein [Desulfobacterales bacterium]|nr:MAG: PocR ligand-binding domain-containing protein [Desulfobacterales bacterium]